MSDRLKELREKRGRIVTEMRSITDAATAEKRDLTDEQLAKHGEMFEEQRKLGDQILAEERSIEASRILAEREGERQEKRRGNEAENGASPVASEEYRAAYEKFVRVGRSGMDADEIRALSVGVGSQGGFMVTPEQMSEQLIRAVDDEVLIRQWATVIPVPDATSLGVPTLDTDPDDADWTSELATGGEDNAMAFGKRKMIPNPLAKRIKISNDLVRKAPGIIGLVAQRLGYKFGIAQEKSFLIGNGASKPLGVFVASNDGIPTSRDLATGNTSSSVTIDGLTRAKYSLKKPYRRKAKFLFHRDGIAQIAILKDNNGQYLWQPSKKEGEPDMILGIPVEDSEYVPNTFTTGQYVGLIGDFSYYWIADAMAMELKRLDELYAETNQIGFIGRMFTDGAPVLAEAFTRIKLG